jgi:glucose/arabinose dehydrogenase
MDAPTKASSQPLPSGRCKKWRFFASFWQNASVRGIFRADEDVAVRRLALALATGIAMLAACVAFVPERYAVNLPLRSLFGGAGTPDDSDFRSRIEVPEGFEIDIWASGIAGARGLHSTELGELLVSIPGRGEILRLDRDDDGDGRSDGRDVLLADLDKPHGMDLYDGWLYVAETGAVGRVRLDTTQRVTTGEYTRVVSNIPRGGAHSTRTIRFGADGWMYVSIGSSCNVCIEDDPRRAAIVRYRPDGSGEQIFATGLRNAVGFDWHPLTGALYANDNGRDLLGDDFPPCELNQVVEGGFYGWPFANGANIPDPDLGDGRAKRIAEATPPALDYPAHNAPLGLTFLRGETLPLEYRHAALSALHGSWNRSNKDGYKVVSLHWREDGTIEQRDFVTGFERDEEVIGRPVDIAEGPDGAIYISDDYAGVIYRVGHTGSRRTFADAR